MPKHIPRIYCLDLREEYFDIPQSQIVHLINVLRLKEGDKFISFNECDGEWLCQISEFCKKRTIGKKETLLRTFKGDAPKLALAVCIIKKEPLRFVIEKGTELGVTDFYPLISDYSCNVCDEKKLDLVAISASEQCERLDIPTIHETQPLQSFLSDLPPDFKWFSAIERQNVNPLDCEDLKLTNCGFIIGPEGGFSDNEKELLSRNTTSISLSKNILKAETAALTCLAVFNSKNL